MTESPQRPRAIVTGGARRVGRAVCLALARAGCDVEFTFQASAEEANNLVVDLGQSGAAGQAWPLDLADLAEVERFGARLASAPGRMDILVHNAATYERSPLGGTAEGTNFADRVLHDYRVNAAAPLLLTRALAARLAESPLKGGGAVVAMCDIHALGRPRKGHVSYSMSKAALAEMVQSLARELAPRVRVNGVAPGVVAFPERGPEADPEMQRQYLSRVPLGRPGSPQDAAEAVRWLALDASYTTGVIVRVDGGRWLA